MDRATESYRRDLAVLSVVAVAGTINGSVHEQRVGTEDILRGIRNISESAHRNVNVSDELRTALLDVFRLA